jgi:hypothetical protein
MLFCREFIESNIKKDNVMREAVIFTTAIALMSKIFRGAANYTETPEISGGMGARSVQRASLKEDEVYA